MKFLTPLLLAAATLLPHALAQQEAAPSPPPSKAVAAPAAGSEQEVSNFMMHYFQHPEPDKIDALIIQWAGLFPGVEECSAIPSTLVFFGEVFKANPERVEGWMQTAYSLPEEWHEIFEWSQRYARGEERDVTAEESMNPGIFDACWGGFIASGDKKYPEYVLRAACMEEAPNCYDLSIRSAAWSCCSFILNYPEMKEIARAWFTTATEEQRMNFARRSNETVQQAVFGTVLMNEVQKKEDQTQHEAKARELADMRRRTGDFVGNYFREPKPEGITELLTLSVQIDPKAAEVNPPLSRMFFGEIFKANPERLEGWQQHIATLPPEWQELLSWSLRYARGEEAHPTTTEKATISTLEACKGGFMASGDNSYLEYLLKLACLEEDEGAHDMAARAMAAFVQWHEPALQLAHNWFATASEEQRKAFARRVDEESQQRLLGTVLVPQNGKSE